MKFAEHAALVIVTACVLAACATEPQGTLLQRSLTSATPDAALRPSAGAHWYKLATEPYKGKQDDIFFVNPKIGFYVNGKGRVFRSDDGGASWSLVFYQPGTYFRAIGMLDERHGFAGNIGTDYFPGVTDETPLYETLDGGNRWDAVARIPGPPVKGICAIDVLHARTINAGVITDRTIVHAAGRVGGPAWLLRSIDGGAHWSKIDMNPYVAMILDVKFFDEMNGVVFAGSDADVERSHAMIVTTNDGGQTWRKAYESARPSELIWKGSFPSRRTGYATVQSYDQDTSNVQRYVVKTQDGGGTWNEIPMASNHDINEFGIGFANEDLGWIGTNKGGFETHDGGATWNPVDLGRVVNKIRVIPEGREFVGFAVGADVYKFGIAPTAPAAPASSAETATIPVARP